MSARELENAEIVPIIECGVSNIKLGIFRRLCEVYKRRFGPDRAAAIAFCVVRHIFLDALNQPALERFAQDNADIIDEEVGKSLADRDLREVIGLAYAVRIMVLAWQTGDAFNDEANQLVQWACDHGIVIPNIVQMWGPSAIVSFFSIAEDFLVRSVQSR